MADCPCPPPQWDWPGQPAAILQAAPASSVTASWRVARYRGQFATSNGHWHRPQVLLLILDVAILQSEETMGEERKDSLQLTIRSVKTDRSPAKSQGCL